VYWLSLHGLKIPRGGNFLGTGSVKLKKNKSILHGLVRNIHVIFSRKTFMDLDPVAVSKIN
jgi:hypothetical protein